MSPSSNADGGTYRDPATGQPLSGQAIAAYASGLWAAFPNLSFEIVSAARAASRCRNTRPIGESKRTRLISLQQEIVHCAALQRAQFGFERLTLLGSGWTYNKLLSTANRKSVPTFDDGR